MPKYFVSICATTLYEVEVEAGNESDAEELAVDDLYDNLGDNDYDQLEIEVVELKESAS